MKIPKQDDKTMGIIYTNACGIYRIKNTCAKIALITETMLNSDILDAEVRIPNFNIFRGDRKALAKGGGSCIYVHNSLSACIIDVNVPDDCVAVKITGTPTPIIVLCVYRSPSLNVTESITMANVLDCFFNSIINDEIVIVAFLSSNYN